MYANHVFLKESRQFSTHDFGSTPNSISQSISVEINSIGLPEIVELAKQSLNQPVPSTWLKEKLKDAEPVNSVAKGALAFLEEYEFDGGRLLSSLQQVPLRTLQTTDALSGLPAKPRGLGRRVVLAVGLVGLFLSVFLYLRFRQGL